MLTHPQFDPVAVRLGPLAVHWYGLTYLAAFALFVLLGRLRLRQPPYARRASQGIWRTTDVEDMLLAGILSALMAFPLSRLRGVFQALATLALVQVMVTVAQNWDSVTNGVLGISGIPKPTVFGLELARTPSSEGATTFHQFLGLEFNSMHMVIFLYLMALALAVLTLWISNRLIRMPIGRAWEALREDEIACRSLGLNPMKIKLSAFTLGAMFAGFGGAFFAARQGIVNPESFTFIESALILAIVVLGGMGSQLGVILAAILLTTLPEIAREFAEYRMLIFGLVMILMMVWRPQGLLPMQRHQVEVK